MLDLILAISLAGMESASAVSGPQSYAPVQLAFLSDRERSTSRRSRSELRERRAERRERREERRERREERNERREDRSNRGSDSYNSNQRDTSRSNRSSRSEERPYRWEDSYDSSRRDRLPSSGARERRAERQVERNPYRSSDRSEPSRSDRRSSDYTIRERRPPRGSDEPRTYVWHPRQSARTADSDERGVRNRNDTNRSSGSPTSSAAQRWQTGNAAPSQPRRVAPAPASRSSVCPGLTGTRRTACLQAEVRRGQAETERANRNIRNLDTAITVACQVRAGAGYAEGATQIARRVAARLGSAIVLRQIGQEAGKAGVEAATGIPTSVSGLAAYAADYALHNPNACARRAR
jgi:hypothetical protein